MIEGVVGDGVSEPLKMHSDLMRSSSDRASKNDRGVGLWIVSQEFKDGRTGFSVGMDRVQSQLE